MSNINIFQNFLKYLVITQWVDAETCVIHQKWSTGEKVVLIVLNQNSSISALWNELSNLNVFSSILVPRMIWIARNDQWHQYIDKQSSKYIYIIDIK